MEPRPARDLRQADETCSSMIQRLPRSLCVELLGNTSQGGLELYGPADFASLVITPGKTDGLSPTPLADKIGTDPGIVHSWQLGPLTSLHCGSTPVYAERPQDLKLWKTIRSETIWYCQSETDSTAPPKCQPRSLGSARASSLTESRSRMYHWVGSDRRGSS